MRIRLRTIAHLSLVLAFGGACKEPAAKTSGVGDVLHPFIVMNASTGDRYCQICAYGGKPKIVLFGDVGDPAIEGDLMRVQALVDRYAGKGLVAFAVFGEITNQTFTPVSDDHKVSADLKTMRERLKLTFPVTIVPASYTEKEKKGYTAFIDSYEIPASRRIFFGDASNKIAFAESLTEGEVNEQFAKLEAELSKL